MRFLTDIMLSEIMSVVIAVPTHGIIHSGAGCAPIPVSGAI